MRLTALPLLLALCGCVPIYDSYHQASSSEGAMEGRCDQGEVGPPSRLAVERGQMQVLVDGRNLSGFTASGNSIDIAFSMPLSSHANFDPAGLQVQDHASGTPVTYTSRTDVRYHHPSFFGELFGNHFASVPQEGVMEPLAIPEVADNRTSGKPVVYTLHLQLKTVPDDLDLHVPQLQLDGAEYPGIDVHFKRTAGTFCVLALPGLNDFPLRGKSH